MPPDFDTVLLRNFLVCARLGNISQAASLLGRTQPALSQQLRRLEDLLGDVLFTRTPSGIRLTEAGQALLPYAERILALVGEAKACVSRAKLSGRCSIGVLEDFIGPALPAIFADFGRLHPETTLELISMVGADMQPALDSGRIQLALGHLDSLNQPLGWTTQMPLLWAIAETMERISDPIPLVMFSAPCIWRDLVQSSLNMAERHYQLVFESGSLTAIQAAVRAGLGVTALLPPAWAPGLQNVQIAQQLPKLPRVEIGLARRPESEGNPLVNAVEEMLKQLV